MTREPPFAADFETPDATVRRLEARRRRIDEHNLARSFGLAERHARKLQRLRARAAEERPSTADEPGEATVDRPDAA